MKFRRRTRPLATSLIDKRLAPRSSTSAEELTAALRAAADIIGALPPEHWLDHIAQVTDQLQLSPGAVHLAVIDAGHAWTEDPRGLSRARMSQTIRQPVRQPAAVGAPAPAVLSAPASPDTMLPGTSPATTWAELANRIDPELTHEPEWTALAAALDRAHAAGYDVETHLPRLATETPLDSPHAARELHYRLVTEFPEAATTPSQHTEASASTATDDAAAVRLREADSTTTGAESDSSEQPEIQRPEQRWRHLADSIDPDLALSAGWGGLAATIDQASREGFDVDTQLPRIAAETPLPENAPALELQYRLLAEVDIEPAQRTGPGPEPARNPRREPPSPSSQLGRDRPTGPRR